MSSHFARLKIINTGKKNDSTSSWVKRECDVPILIIFITKLETPNETKFENVRSFHQKIVMVSSVAIGNLCQSGLEIGFDVMKFKSTFDESR